MPLCSIEVPRRSTPDIIEKAKDLAGQSLEIIHSQLNIPDPEDMETNVIEGDGQETSLTISFTVGPNEYPDFPNPAFNPTDSRVTHTGLAIHEKARQTELNVSQTTIKAWKNTTFILRDQNAPEPIPPAENLKTVGSSIKRPQLRLIVSPEKQQKPATLPKEMEPSISPESNFEFINTLGHKLAEVLGLPENSPIPVCIQPTLFADTDFAVEFDCLTTGAYQIPEDVRIYLAQLVEQQLNQNFATKNGSAEVWIRQGQPAKHQFVNA